MASTGEKELAASLTDADVKFLWQAEHTHSVPKLDYRALYGVGKSAEPDFYLPESDVFVEVKGQMTLHQVSKMLYLATESGRPYYVYQYTEEDWDPTIEALIPVERQPPDSKREGERRAFNRKFQQRELLYVASHPASAAAVSRATVARLRGYIEFFDRHLRSATRRGLL